MRKILLNFICTSFMLFPISSYATFLTFSDRHDPTPDPLISWGSNINYEFTHNIILDQDGAASLWNGAYGYNPLTDTISGATIVLRFNDESGDTVSESVQLIFDAQSFGSQTITSGGTIFTASFSSGLDTLLNDGILNVNLLNSGNVTGAASARSDFVFLDSTLTVSVDRQAQTLAQPISEPATLAIFLFGLTGLTFSRSKPKGMTA